MLEYVALWFILKGGGGYIPTQDVHAAELAASCGKPGAIVGVQFDRAVNPTIVRWADPKTPGQHCAIDIRVRVEGLVDGEYHFATTEMGKTVPFGTKPVPYIGIDPHTSAQFLRSRKPVKQPPKPGAVRKGGE